MTKFDFTKFDFGSTIAAIACTIVFSSIAIFGAVGPAQAGASPAAIVQAA